MKKSMGERVFDFFNYTFLILAATTMVLPLINLLAVSLSGPIPAESMKVFLLPVEFTTAAWKEILSNTVLWKSFGVTVLLTVVGTFLSLFFTVLTAFPLSRREFLLRKPIMFAIVITMIFNAPMIPYFLTVRAVGLMDSFWALIIPGLISAFNMVIVRTFFLGIPSELDDAAKIDGCHDFRLLFQIYLPLSKPVLATIGLFYAAGYWNTFKTALLFIRDQKLWPLQLRLRSYFIEPEEIAVMDLVMGDYNFNMTTLKAATVIFAVVPILLVYPYLQKYFVKGAHLGSLKG